MISIPKGKFFCFSPPVMIATFIFEVGAALFLIWRYKMSKSIRLVVLLLFCLATFQLAEYMICEAVGLNTVQWARVGYVAITLLPPLGIHLIEHLSGKPSKLVLLGAYGVAIPFLFFFALANTPFGGQQCLGNYVIFEVPRWILSWYTAYYYGLLFVGIIRAWHYGRQGSRDLQQNAFYLLAVGYMAFLLPTATVGVLQPNTLHGIPSIMCGFAVILAVILTFGVVPLVDRRKRKGNNKT